MTAVIGKARLTDTLNALLEPMREKRRQYENNLPRVKEIILEGTRRANSIGNETLSQVKEAIGLIL